MFNLYTELSLSLIESQNNIDVKDVVVEKYGGKVEMHARAGPVRSKPRSNSIYKYSPKENC